MEETFKGLRALGDRIIVRAIRKRQKGTIIIPEQFQKNDDIGEVLALGKGFRNEDGERIAIDLKVGDYIMYGRHAGTEIELRGEKLLIMRESDVYCTIGAEVVKEETALESGNVESEEVWT